MTLSSPPPPQTVSMGTEISRYFRHSFISQIWDFEYSTLKTKKKNSIKVLWTRLKKIQPKTASFTSPYILLHPVASCYILYIPLHPVTSWYILFILNKIPLSHIKCNHNENSIRHVKKFTNKFPSTMSSTHKCINCIFYRSHHSQTFFN